MSDSPPRISVLALAIALSACGASTASYTRFRRAAEEGRVVAASEVRAADFIGYHATEDAPRPPPGTAAEAPIWLEARAGRSVISDASSHVPLMVSLRGGVAAYRAPAEIVIVVDVSGSMQEGDKIGAVRHALARFVERLDPRDHLAIVTFSDAAHVALPPSEVASARAEVLGAIEGLGAFGGTNLHDGLRTGLDHAVSMGTGASLRHLILLSDGIASVGVRDRAAFDALARRAHDARVTLTTVGMGDAIDFALLEALATTAGGEHHYLDRPSEVERLFSTEIVQLLTVAARDVRVRVALPPGWGLFQSFHEGTERVGDVLETRLGDLSGDGAEVVLVELTAPAGSGTVTVPVEITLGDAAGNRSLVARADVTVARSPAAGDALATDPMVLRNLVLGRTAVAVRTAATLSESGDTSGARGAIEATLAQARDAVQVLAAMGEHERAASLAEPIALLESTLAGLPLPSAPVAPASGRFAGWR
jgi:Ca-activated chloride channel family protein